MTVSDGTPPILDVLSPAPNAQLIPGSAVPVTILVQDNSSNVTLEATLTRAVSTNTQSIAVTLTPNTPATNVILFPLPSQPTNGSPVFATIVATDHAGNATTVTTIFWLPGTQTTVTWDRQALGQILDCSNGPGTYTWPNDSNWSQSVVLGTPCGPGAEVPVQPSNWSTTNYPNGTNLDVILGGLGGAPANLDVSVALHSVTIQSNGGLNMAFRTTLSAVNYEFQGDGQITTGGSAILNLDGGTMDKTAGTNTFTMDSGIALNSFGGTFEADSGTLALPANSTYTNGAFIVASNAAVVLIPGGSSTFGGTFTGSGTGAVLLNGGSLNVSSGGLALDLPDPLFQWSGGDLSGNVTNLDVFRLTGSNTEVLQRGSQFYNVGFFHHTGLGGMDLRLSAVFDNAAAGTYDFESDGGLFTDDSTPQNFNNYGMVRKSAGTNTSTISILFNNLGGSIDVESGTLALANNGVSSNGNFTVGAGAALNVTGGQSPSWAGLMTGQGAGAVMLDSGVVNLNSAQLDFPGGLFQWTGGTLSGAASNLSVINLSGASTSTLQRNTQIFNSGLVRHTGLGGLDLRLSSVFANLPGGMYDFENDGGVFTDDSTPQNFYNYGTLRKSAGTNTSTISISFNNLGGLVDVESGALTLANNGASSNGTFVVGSGAALDITGGQAPTWSGEMVGQGAGQIEFYRGTLNANALLLNFTNGLFQWNGGNLAGVASNINVLSLSATNANANTGTLARSSRFYNLNLVRHTGLGKLDLRLSSMFANLPGGTYDFENDGAIYTDDSTPQNFYNYGILRKSAGTNTSVISILFDNLGGLIDVESGTLSLANNGISTNGNFNVAAGAALDITGGQNPTWSGEITGQGAGTVMLDAGILNAQALQLNFVDGLFQWSGGGLAGVATNLNAVTISTTNAILTERNSQFYNAGVVHHSGIGGLDLRLSSTFVNLPNGTYDFENNGRIFTDDSTPQNFNNFGTVRKTAGTNASSISILFNNLSGLIDVESGTLTLANNGSSSNGVFTVAAGAVLDVAGGQSPTWSGEMSGQGLGAVLFDTGTLTGNPVTLNFTNGLFQWAGGAFSGVATNVNAVTISGLDRQHNEPQQPVLQRRLGSEHRIGRA